jgi:hypothetical protein
MKNNFVTQTRACACVCHLPMQNGSPRSDQRDDTVKFNVNDVP